jgi:hypothetical protein
VVTLAFKTILDLALAWKSGLKSAFAAFRDLLPSANYSAGDSNGVWHNFFLQICMPNSNYCQQKAAAPNPASSNFLKKCAKLPLLSAAVFHTRLVGQHCPLRTNRGVFFKGGKTL